MGQSKLELAVGTGQWDAGLKKAQQALNAFTQAQGGLQQALKKDNGDMQKFIQMMGKMDSTANTAKGQMNDYKRSIEQLSAEYEKMSATQKATIGQDYLQTIDALKQKFQAAKQQVEDLNKSLNDIGDTKLPEMKGGGSMFGGLTDMLSVAGGNLIASGIQKLGSEMAETVKQSIDLAKAGEGVRLAFDRLNRPDLLNNLKEATHGTVSELELMKAAVKFDDFKLPVEELGTLLAFAQKKAKDTGQSVDYMVDSIVTGLGRKSLMILDNLGLSAAQIKERMAETGDMTKAVADIIKEQMSEAGEYVETAADRAARAAADAQNEMEELGRKAMPVAEEWGKAWNEIKISGMEVINFVLTPIAESLRSIREILSGEYTLKIKAEYDTPLGSNVDDKGNFIKRPANGNWAGFDAENGTWKTGYYGAIYNGETGQTELPDITVTGNKRTKKTKKTGSGSNVKVPTAVDFKKFNMKSILGADSLKGSDDANFLSPYLMMLDDIKKKVLDIQDIDWAKSFGGVSDEYLSPLQRMNKELADMKANLETAPDTESYKASLQAIADKEKEIAKFKGIETLSDGAKSAAKSFHAAAGAISHVGSALSSIEDPTVKILAMVMQGIAGVAQGAGMAISKAGGETTSWYEYLAAAVSITAQMITTIAQIHASTGYAEGGMIKGNSYSGDRIGGLVDGSQFVGLNAGELVLNASQQSMLASNLQNSGGGGGGTQLARISGEQIYVAVNRYLKRTGQGELATWVY